MDRELEMCETRSTEDDVSDMLPQQLRRESARWSRL